MDRDDGRETAASPNTQSSITISNPQSTNLPNPQQPLCQPHRGAGVRRVAVGPHHVCIHLVADNKLDGQTARSTASSCRKSVAPARIQGQLDGLQAITGALPEAKITHLGSGATLETGQAVISAALHTWADEHRLAVISFNDDVGFGALHAFRKAGREVDLRPPLP